MARIGIGSSYLPELSLNDLENLHKKEDNKKAKVRLLCAVHRKRGRTIMDISDAVSLPKSTVSDHLRRLHFKGLNKRYDIKNKGAVPKLAKQQEKELFAFVSKGKTTSLSLQQHIKAKYHQRFTLHGIRKMLRRLGAKTKGKRPYEWVIFK